MSIQYTNRRGDVYTLYQGVTKKGNPRYLFAKKSKSEPAQSIPDGYEIYENPEGRVFLRKTESILVTEQEKRLVEQGIEKYGAVKYFIVDMSGNMLTVHTSANDPEESLANMGMLGRLAALSEDYKQSMLRYMAVMRFKLVDEEERLFIVQRFCFKGAIDDWIDIGGAGKLEDLVGTFASYIGRESFYELI